MRISSDANLLAIETSTRRLQLAVRFGGDRLVQSSEVVDTSHGRLIVKKIGELLTSASMQRTDIEGLVVSRGPGSFTGLRIGIAVAKGMAVGLNIPAVGVTLFELAAERFSTREGAVRVVVPFKRDRHFLGTVEGGQVDLSKVVPVPEADLADAAGGSPMVAIGFEADSQFFAVDRPMEIEPVTFDAADLLRLGARKLAESEPDDLERLEPLYLGKSQAEIRFEQRKNRPQSGD
jgi:tRNA threonylcarbamoyl adenosine modification protein YeaZ